MWSLERKSLDSEGWLPVLGNLPATVRFLAVDVMPGTFRTVVQGKEKMQKKVLKARTLNVDHTGIIY